MIQVDGPATNQMGMLCKGFPPTLAGLCILGMGLELASGFYPPPPPTSPAPPRSLPKTLDWNKKEGFFKYAIFTWWFSNSPWDVEAKSWDREMTSQTVRVGRSANSQIHKFFMSSSSQRFLFPATRARNLMSIRSAVEWFKSMRI